MYIAHKREDGAVQPLSEHLRGVGQLVGEFAAPFGASEHAKRTGLLHDLGKYSFAGQRRMRDPEHAPKADHSTAGAKEARNLGDIFAAFAIAGHHAGLMNLGSQLSLPEDGTLFGRLRKRLDGALDYANWRDEIAVDPRSAPPAWLDPLDQFGAQFYIRMLFSCLVDADLLDAERFLRGEVERQIGDSPELMLEKLREYVAPWLAEPEGELNRRRCAILRACLDGAELDPGLFTLRVPAGGGKTVSSLAFALAHAACHGLRRVIYVAPYAGVVEQNAQLFRDILGDENVLEYHCDADLDGDPEGGDEHLLYQKLATENWDAPVIVTTAVQFFESLYSARVSRCRKLHNIADSVVVFDEAQTLPANYLRPCAAAVAELAERYRVSAVLCTAAQPALDELLHEFAPSLPIRELCPDPEGMAEAFRCARFDLRGRMEPEALAEELVQQKQVLCVVNTRARAQALWELLPEEGRFQLSKRMTAGHRCAVLAEIRRRLAAGEVCRVISASLIEAGVDVDFPRVWRELAGLDSILQAAGRCNREGRRGAEESAVCVFSFGDRPPLAIRQNVSAAQRILDSCPQLDAPEAVRAYYTALRELTGSFSDYKNILSKCAGVRFRDVNDEFHLTDGDSAPVYIPTESNAALIGELRAGNLSRALLRRLGRSAVDLPRRELRPLLDAGALERTSAGACILTDLTLYDPERGLLPLAGGGNALFI